MTDNNKNKMFLVLLETSGNQNYIFSTNKLRENIGASELTYQSGTQWVLEAIETVTPSGNWSLFKTNEQLRDKLLDTKNLNKPIEESEQNEVEVLIANSGKALLITKKETTAKDIICYVTKKAIKEAPMLDICGVYCQFDFDKDDLGKINAKLHQKIAYVHSLNPSPALRFLRLPIIQECSTSEFPATSKTDARTKKPISPVSASKQKDRIQKQAFERISNLLKNNQEVRFARGVNELEKLKLLTENSQNWSSVIHADGNGLGQIFLKFSEYTKGNRDYINKYREFSIALDVCTEKAFLTALKTIKPVQVSDNPNDKKVIPLIPLILGGDDLTVICEGKYALNFTKTFLEEFEKETGETQKIGEHKIDIIRTIAGKAFNGVKHLSACAGVAIIKPHFPFSVAYHLAEDLIKKAKEVKKIVTQIDPNGQEQPYPCSAIDFHILYDSSDVDLKLIRKKLTINETTILHNRPYVITPLKQLNNARMKDWVEFHHWDTLVDKVQVINTTDEEGKKELPSSQVHDLRSALFLGKEVANARYQLIKERYPNLRELASLENENSLFGQEPKTPLSKDKTVDTTGLLDAIDASEFLQ